MTTDCGAPPLVRWDGLHLVLHLPAIEDRVRTLVRDVDSVSDPRLSGSGDTLRLEATVRAKGLASRVEVELREVRIRLRRLGFRIGRIRVMRGVRVPRALVEMALGKAAPDLVTVLEGTGVVVVDLRRWIPAEAEITVVAVQVIGERLHLWLGPGSLARFPAPETPLLAPGEE